MPVSVMMDIAIVAVFLLFTLLGWKRGLFRSLAELAAMALALLLASQIAAAAAPAVIDKALRPAAHEAIAQRVDEMMAENVSALTPAEELLRVVDSIPNRFVRERAAQLVERLDLSSAAAGDSARETLLRLGYQLADMVLDGVAYSLVHSIVYLVCFMVLTFLLRLAVRLVSAALRLPVLRQFNEAGGALLGMVKGAVVICLVVWVLGRTGTVTPGMAEGSVLFAPLADWIGAIGGGLTV